MKDKLNQTIEGILHERQTRRRYAAILLVLALITVLSVNWSLHQQGLSMTADAAQATAETAMGDTAGQGSEAMLTTLDLPDGEYAAAVQANGTEIDMGKYVTGLSGEGTKYDASGNLYSSDLEMDFTFPESTVTSGQLGYYYEYPDGIIIPGGLLNNQNRDLLDSDGKKAGTYRFEKTENGKYRVYIDFDPTYVTEQGDSAISGNINFSGQVDGSKGDENGNIKIEGKDGVTLEIPKDQITYPGNETNRYDIKTKKEGSLSSDGKTLTYTVYVYSMKGTPDVIDFTDTIKAAGLTLGDPTDVTVKKQTVKKYPNDRDGEGTLQNEETINTNPGDYTYNKGTLSMTLPKIDPATHNEATSTELANDEYTRYKITYTYAISDIGDNAFADNAVTSSSSKNGTTVKAEDKSHINVNTTTADADIEKTGTGAGEGAGVDYITWTIKVNPNEKDIAGATLSDEMFKNIIWPHITINPGDGWNYVTDADNNVTGIKFLATENGENHKTYTISYRTPMQSTWNNGQNGTITNKATITDKDGNSQDATADATNVPPVRVDKTMDGATENGNNTVTINWTVKITVPSDYLPEGTVITDDPTHDHWGGTGGTQYRTKEQALAWINSLSWANASGDIGALGKPDLEGMDVKFKGSDGKDYTLAEVQSSNDSSLTYTIATITLKQDLQTPAKAAYLMFHYTTTADVTDASATGTNYYNTASVNDKYKDDGVYTHKKSSITKTDENNVTDTTQKKNEDGTLTWKIKVSLGKDTNSLTITDKLPDGVTLVSIAGEDKLAQLNASIDNGTVSGTAGNYTVSGTYQDNKLELTLTNGTLPSGMYTLVVTCKVDTGSIDGYEKGKTYTFTNEASASDDKGEIGNADQTQEWTEGVDDSKIKTVDKSGKWDNDTRRIKYTITLNPTGRDIVEGSESLKLEDVFEYFPKIYGKTQEDYENGTGPETEFDLNAWLVPDSVKLYRAVSDGNGGLTKGDEITNWTWTVKTGNGENGKKASTLVGTDLPDSTPLILEYDYQLESQMPKDWHSSNNLIVSNNAQLTGTGYKDGGKQNDVSWGKQESSGTVNTDIHGTLYKVSKGSYGKTLPGATFKLQQYNTTTSTYDDVEGVTYTTDNDGKFTVKRQKNTGDVQYEYNVLYRVVETAPPQGYLMPNDPESNAFYFYFSNEEDTTNILPTDLPAEAADLSKASKTVYVENESSTTEVTINKQWLNQDGSTQTGHTGSIQVKLYQIATTTPSGGGTATLSGEIKGFNSWGNYDWETSQNYWKAIEGKEYPAGTTISFTLKKSVWVTGEPEIKVNGQVCEAVVTDFDSNNKNYTYTFTLSSGANKLSGLVPTQWAQMDGEYTLSELIVKEPENTGGSDTPAEPTKTLYDTYDITSGENWSKTISGLPTKGKDENGNTVYYTYCIEEVGGENYDVSYDNNGGIASGTITVKNTESDSPSYVLPSTGGPGTTLFTTGGLALMGGALLYGYLEIRRKKREVKRSF